MIPIKINYDLCDECGTCISVCPKDAMLLSDKLYILKDGCIGCGVCVNICPVGALSKEDRS